MALLPVVVVSAKDRNLKASIFFFFLSGDTQKNFMSDVNVRSWERNFPSTKKNSLLLFIIKPIEPASVDFKKKSE